MKLAVISALVCVLFGVNYAQQDACLDLSECMVNAQEKFDECQELMEEKVKEREERMEARAVRRGGRGDGGGRGRGGGRWAAQAGFGPEAQQCLSEMRDIMKKKHKIHEEKSRVFESCIQARLDMSEELPIDETLMDRKCAKAERKFEMRQSNVEGRGNRRRNGRMNSVQLCRQEAKAIKNQCKLLAGCCSEGPICHLEYEVSDIHDQIKQLQLDVLLKRRECLKGGGVYDNDIVPGSQIVDADL